MQPNMNWTTVLEHHADRMPDKALVIFEGETITYGQMLDSSRRLAGGFASHGVAKDDVVGILAYNSASFLEVIFAANHLGAVAMPINWRLAAPEVRYILENSEAKMLVTDGELQELGAKAGAGASGAAIGVCIDDIDTEGWWSVRELRESSSPHEGVEVAGVDLHRLMYTSGTTSRPKGVMITHDNLTWKNIAHVVEFGVTPHDIGLACGPLYHVGALDLTTTTMIYAGATTVIHRRFDAEAVIDEIESSRITNVWLAPAMINAILNLPGVEDRDLDSVRFIVDGGEKMPVPLIKKLERVFPSAWFADAYGLTETVSGDTFLDKNNTLNKLGSVGKPCLHVEMDIWDTEGNPLPPGEEGEIVLRGPKLFTGYWKNPEATDEAFAGGWFHTGDLGVIDEDGFLYIIDRLKDMILSGGENVAGSEVERVLYEDENIIEAAVVARPDDRWGEVPVAFVVLTEEGATTEDEIMARCAEELAKFKVPKSVSFVDELPRNPSGKVLKRELRKRIEEETV